MIPTTVIDTLAITVSDAVDLAAEGKLADGYAALLAGRRRAEEIAAEGVEWGEELLRWWQGACENYCDRYGVPLAEADRGPAVRLWPVGRDVEEGPQAARVRTARPAL